MKKKHSTRTVKTMDLGNGSVAEFWPAWNRGWSVRVKMADGSVSQKGWFQRLSDAKAALTK